MRMGGRGAVALVLACGAVFWMGGCARKEGARAEVGAKTPSEPFERSVLREWSLEVIEKAARSDEPQTRANAIEAISLVPSRAPRLVEAGLDDPSAGVRSVTAMVAGRLRMEGLGDRLVRLTLDESAFVQLSALYAAKRVGREVDLSPIAGYLLKDPSPRVRSHAAFVLGELGEASSAALLRQAAKERMVTASPIGVRLMQLQIAEAMVKVGDEEQIETIWAALYPAGAEELEATALAVQILGQLGTRNMRSSDHLRNLVNFEQGGSGLPPEIRLGIAASLAAFGEDGGVVLADAHRGSKNVNLRVQAAQVYGLTEKEGNLGKLQRMLEDPEERVRVAAAAGVLRALGE